VGAWEFVVNALASRAGVMTPEVTSRRFASRHHTFLSRRFDRTAEGKRVHFASAMTLAGREDGEEGASYIDLVSVITQVGAHPARDLEQLWRRVVFNVCVSNADDHLRNHGFLLERNGWALAPAYDMNPVAGSSGLTLNISETDNAQDLELVRDAAKHFRVKLARANEVIAEVAQAVQSWRAEAEGAGIGRSEQERMASAFRLAELA
jgi:serine/threonine-protein kinase HipA